MENTERVLGSITEMDLENCQLWLPTNWLRNIDRRNDFKLPIVQRKVVLQQLHTSNLGNRKWVDVPTETEE